MRLVWRSLALSSIVRSRKVHRYDGFTLAGDSKAIITFKQDGTGRSLRMVAVKGKSLTYWSYFEGMLVIRGSLRWLIPTKVASPLRVVEMNQEWQRPVSRIVWFQDVSLVWIRLTIKISVTLTKVILCKHSLMTIWLPNKAANKGWNWQVYIVREHVLLKSLSLDITRILSCLITHSNIK